MLLLKNARVIHFYPPEILADMDVLIEGQTIKNVGKGLERRYSPERTIDVQHHYLSPGIVCAHNHFYSALARGIIADIPPSDDFVSILKNLWWRLDQALDEEALFTCGLVGALEAVKVGTTAVIDHNASPSFIRGSLNTLRRSFEKIGLRGILAYEVTDRHGKKGALAGVEESVDFIRSLNQTGGSPLIEGAVGAHAPFTLSDQTLAMLAEAIREVGRGIHIHVAEDRYDPSHSHHHYGQDVLTRLENFNLLNEQAILVHGVHLSRRDIDILNSHEAFLIHNPRSNMNNAVGYMGRLSLVKNWALGTDGIGSNMWEELKFAYFKQAEEKAGLSIPNFLEALQNGNRLLQRYFRKPFGRVEKGYMADLVIYDYSAPTPLLPENLAGHLVFGFASRDVQTVIINGQIVMENRRFPFDTDSIYGRAQKVAERLWKKMNKIKP
ncbi:MAG: putative aminohydrolase SsnA [Calditrichia bacterium]